MRKTRAVFKLALRYCQNHIGEMRADACAECLFDSDSRKFWKNVHKMCNNRATCYVNSVGGAVGPVNVTNMWKSHFEELYSCGVDSKHREIFYEKLNFVPVLATVPLLNIFDIDSAIRCQKAGKSAGPDGIQTEAFIHAGPR